MTDALTPSEVADLCKHGHRLVGDNLRVRVRRDGRIDRICAECARGWSKKNYQKNKAAFYARTKKWRAENREDARRDSRRQYATNAEKRREAARQRCLSNPDKQAARRTVRTAIESGELVRPSGCSCCSSSECRIEAHHDDYSKPLDVIWLCASCHQSHHADGRAAESEAGDE